MLTYLPEEAGAYHNLSGMEYLEFMARFSERFIAGFPFFCRLISAIKTDMENSARKNMCGGIRVNGTVMG